MPSSSQKHMKTPLALAIAIICTQASITAAEAGKLEEIIVTSQKRAENLQQVPLSVATISGDKLDKSGIANLNDLTAHMPNIHFTETGLSTQVRVRGIGSDNSQGFEQSVGMYVDGIHYGRAQLFRAPMMDMERAELLRGPQSTLFGKNSIAGALNLTTARPTTDPEARLALSQELEFNTTEVNAMFSGPLAESAQARLALRRVSDDGYVVNSYLGKDHPEREETSVRLSFAWQPTDKLEMFIKGEQNKFENIGRAAEITYDAPLVEGGTTYNEGLQALGQPGFETKPDYVRQADSEEFSDNTINNLTFKADYALGDHTLTAVTGLLSFDYLERCDCDFVASEILNVRLSEEYEQFSQEIRIASPQDQSIEWLAGVFYQSYEQNFWDQIDLPDTAFLTSLYPTLTGTGVRRDFEQNSNAWALFGRVTWHASEAWHITLGARYTEESKDADKMMNVVDLQSNNYYQDPVTAFTYMGLFLAETEQARYFPNPAAPPEEWAPIMHSGHNVSGSRDESAFTPLLNIEYDVNSDVMAYASYTTGFKAGGFDPRSNSVGLFDYRVRNPMLPAPPEEESDPLQHFEFEEESVTAMELGMKTTLFDGRADLNFALYRTEYEDLQISQYDGGVGFNVGNAKDTVVQGLEIDGRWLVAEQLTASYGFSYLDFDYKDFKNGNCYAGQTPDGVDLDGNGTIDTCDYTGMRGVYSPEFTINLALDYYHPITSQLDFISVLDWQFIDSHQVHVNLDPEGAINSYNLLGLRLGVETENWSLAVLGKNLLDEYIISYSGNASLADTAPFNANTHYSFVRRPRTITLEATLKL
ncbi:Outer membrane receptor proteins, mostly Fe transport [Alteromonadaceae bacterium Bs31]|nr:Outer membrane receptor proteins, mostly Fe transport [Alteromonadaceae bacterium Bs31]